MRRAIFWMGFLTATALVALGIAYLVIARPTSQFAPEAARILAAQTSLPFQVLIPAYLPSGLDRSSVKIQVDRQGAEDKPSVELQYRGPVSTVIIRQWMPGRANQETLIGAVTIDTKWGKGLLRAGARHEYAVVWADIGAVRVGVYSPPRSLLSQEELVGILETMGPAANRQVFSYLKERPTIREALPPPPFEAALTAEGLQEITLVVTPGGYSPARFALQKGIPTRLTFRQLGRVACGNVLVFPASPATPAILQLATAQDKQVLEFTPQVAGTFEFHCQEYHYKGILIVRDDQPHTLSSSEKENTQ